MATTATLSTLVVPTVRSQRDGRHFASTILWVFRFALCAAAGWAFYSGGTLQRAVATAVLLLGLLGERMGAVRQILHLVALPLAIFVGFAIGWPLGISLGPALGLTPPLAGTFGALMLAVVTIGVASLVAGGLSRAAARHWLTHILNRVGGGVVGIAEGGLLALTACWLLAIFGPSLARQAQAVQPQQPQLAAVLTRVGRAHALLADDPAARWAEQYNVLRRVRPVMTAAALSEVAAEPTLFCELVRGDLSELDALPHLQIYIERFRADPALQQAVQKHDLEAILSNAQIHAALRDEELCKEILAHWQELKQQRQ